MPAAPLAHHGWLRRHSQRSVLMLIVLFLLAPHAVAAQSEADPLERVNRKIFAFNEGLDRYLLRPVARGWKAITPELLRESLRHFDDNIQFPIVVVNSILQWQWRAAGIETARFAINTTIGLAGFRDAATGFGLQRQIEDTGQTFAVWGIPAGPYVVLPLFGPSNPRDAVGLVADSFLSIYWIAAPFYVSLGYSSLDIVNRRALADPDIESARRAALDFYVFVRNAYIQRRAALIRNMAEDEVGDDLYDLEDDDDLYEFEDDGE